MSDSKITIPVARRPNTVGIGCIRRLAIGVVFLGLLPVLAPAAHAQGWGDAGAGREIAERWCSECHMVSPGQAEATPDVPTFMEIARNADDDLAVVAGFLMDPHPPMAGLSLSRQEIRHLVAYFATLR